MDQTDLIIVTPKPFRWLGWGIAVVSSTLGLTIAIVVSFVFFPVGLLALVIPSPMAAFFIRASRIVVQSQGELLNVKNLFCPAQSGVTTSKPLTLGRVGSPGNPGTGLSSCASGTGRTVGLDICARSDSSPRLAEDLARLRRWLTASPR